MSNALGGKVEKKKFGGARIEDIQKNVRDLLASKSMDCGTQLIIHVGTNNLVYELEDVVVRKMESLVTETKMKVKSKAVSSVITRKDVLLEKNHTIQQLTEGYVFQDKRGFS